MAKPQDLYWNSEYDERADPDAIHVFVDGDLQTRLTQDVAESIATFYVTSSGVFGFSTREAEDEWLAERPALRDAVRH